MNEQPSVNSLYEARDLPKEESDSESSEDEQAAITNDIVVAGKRPLLHGRVIPRDRYGVVYIIFYFLGISSLLPWNFFITANQYWMYKFRNVSYDHTNITELPKTEFQIVFTSYLCIASVIPGTIFLFLNTYFAHRIRHEVRLILSLVIIIALFIYTTILVETDTDCWQGPFFAMTMASTVFLNAFSAVQQGGMFGLLGKFPSGYMVGAVSGQALGGIFSALASVISIAFGASPSTSALIYFLIADTSLILSLASYIAMTRMEYFVYHMEGHESHSVNATAHYQISYWRICQKIWMNGVSIMLTFAVSMAIFPSVSVLVESVNHGDMWSEVYFVPVICFLGFNSGDFIGRIAGGWVRWPRKGSPLILVASIARIGFIPLILFCNFQPRSHLPVVFTEDYQYVLILACLALSNGYLGSLNFMYAPQMVTKEEQETAASMLTTFLGCGVSLGVIASFLLLAIP